MKRLLPRFALAIAAAALSLGLGEIVVRLLGAAPGYAAIPFGQYATSADPELLWAPRPGAEGVNAAGLRGDEVAAEKTRPRWLVLGDSIAWGIDLADEQTIPVRLAAHLAAAGLDVEVLNGGVSAYNTVQEARRLELLAPRLEPDHVVLLVCVNDVDTTDVLPEGVLRSAHEDDAARALARVHDLGRGSPLRRELLARSHLLRLLHGALTSWPRPRQTAESDESEPALDVVRAGLARIAAVAAGQGLSVTVVTVPMFKDLGPDYPYLRLHAEVLAASHALGFDTLDLLPLAIAAAGHDPQSLSLPGDLLHPNAQGADLIAEAIAARWSEAQAGSAGD